MKEEWWKRGREHAERKGGGCEWSKNEKDRLKKGKMEARERQEREK